MQVVDGRKCVYVCVCVQGEREKERWGVSSWKIYIYQDFRCGLNTEHGVMNTVTSNLDKYAHINEENEGQFSAMMGISSWLEREATEKTRT